MKDFDQYDQDRASKYANMIEYTRLADIVTGVQIYFDPDDMHSVIEEDRALLEEYYTFQRIIQNATESEIKESVEKPSLEKWILRMEFDADIMLEKNITMDDIHFAIINSYKDRVSCIYSDYNSNKLIFRIRLNASPSNSSSSQNKK